MRPITGTELTVLCGRRPPPCRLSRQLPAGAFHLTLLVEDATGYRNLCRLLTLAHAAHPRATALPLPPGGRAGRPRAPRRAGSSASPAAPATAPSPAGSPAAAMPGPSGSAGALLRIFGPDRFRVEIQRPLWRGDRARNRRLAELAETARGPLRRDRQRPLPRPPPGGAPGRPRRGPARRHPGVDRARAARQRLGDAGRPGPGGRPLRRAPRGRGRERPAGRAAGLRPDPRPRLQLPGAEDGTADRRLAEACRARFGERYDGTPERAEAERRLEQELRVISEPRSSPASSCCTATCSSSPARSPSRSAGATAPGRCCRRGAGGARASARSSAT